MFYYLLILVLFACNFYFYLLNPNNDEETKSDDPTQYKIVTKLEVDILFDNIKNNADLSTLKKFHLKSYLKKIK